MTKTIDLGIIPDSTMGENQRQEQKKESKGAHRNMTPMLFFFFTGSRKASCEARRHRAKRIKMRLHRLAEGGMNMKKIELIIRPEKLEPLKKILSKNEYSGLTVMSAMGCGHQKGYSEEFKKLGMEINLLPKLYVMTVILDEDLDDILTEICEKLSTGQVGDGKIFITNVDDVMRIRTGEHGESIL